MNREVIQKIYQKLGDDVSRKIYTQRLLFSLTSDDNFIRRIVLDTPGGKDFFSLLDHAKDESEIVIFGVGVWGKDLYNMTKDYPWKEFVDSNPRQSEFGGLPVISYAEFIDKYQDETIVISSRIHYKSMYEQLMQSGIRPEKVINAGFILDELSKSQYFDLDVFQPKEEEVFVDAGSFDGMTSVYFQDWCEIYGGGGGIQTYVYAFEPDLKNAEKCGDNLKTRKISHKIITKGVWSKEDTLHFQAISNGASSVNAEGEESIDVTSIDKELKGKSVTFIKMDIEGSEYEALLGAVNVITENKPKLAISIYHRPEDIWELPEIILRYNPEYKLYLRHYSLTDFETVLYALP